MLYWTKLAYCEENAYENLRWDKNSANLAAKSNISKNKLIIMRQHKKSLYWYEKL